MIVPCLFGKQSWLVGLVARDPKRRNLQNNCGNPVFLINILAARNAIVVVG